MPWSQADVDWVAARLAADVVAIRRRDAYRRQTRQLEALYRELAAFMKIRITEPVFFQGAEREVGDVIDVPAGPYRFEVQPGGLKRVPQFVEMPEEIKQVIQATVAEPVTAPAPSAAPSPASVAPPPVVEASELPKPPPAAGTFAEATAAALKPAPSATPKPTASLAARIRALTTRKAKFHDLASGILDTGEGAMAQIENDGPPILQRAAQSMQDDVAAIVDLGDALKEMGNGPLSG